MVKSPSRMREMVIVKMEMTIESRARLKPEIPSLRM
jgi:hypothetical protein